jgi:RimJ/RimL family protein N-acetyltransferase
MNTNEMEADGAGAKWREVSCRKVTLGDLSLLRKWYDNDECRRQLYAAPDDDTDFAFYMLQPYRYIVMVGSIGVGTFKLEKQGVAGVLGLLVAPEWRGKGLSQEIIRLAEAEAKKLGFHVLSVDIYSDNQAAVASFVGSGFREFVWYEKNI